ncbi:hypothetical protein Btru_059089 [Bulinus truncatus]|nr:hypothetical protein Btru_059089 [Bulinus truncatus]
MDDDQVDEYDGINQSTILEAQLLSSIKDEGSCRKKASLNPVVVLEKLSFIEEAVKLYGNLKKDVDSSSMSAVLTKSELKRKTWYDENDSLSDISVSDIEISDTEELMNPQFISDRKGAEKNREKQSSTKPPCKKVDSKLEPLIATSKASKSEQKSSSDSVSVSKDAFGEKKDTKFKQAEMKNQDMSKQIKNVKANTKDNNSGNVNAENKDTASLVSAKQEKNDSEDAGHQLKTHVMKKMDNIGVNEAESQVNPSKEAQRKNKRLLSADSSPFENAKVKQPKLETVPLLTAIKETLKVKENFSSNMRYELDLHNITTADIGNEAFRKFINLASDCAIQFSNKKASASPYCSVALYFGDALSLQSAMQKLSQMPVISDNNWIRGVIKCVEINPTQLKDKDKWTKSLIAKMIFQFNSGKAEKLRQLYAYKDRKKEGTKRKSAQVHRIPSAMNREMLALLFPFSLNIQISDTDLHQKGVKGPVSVEFDNQDWMEAVLTCFQDFVYVSSNQYAKPFYLKIDNFTPPPSPKTEGGDRSRQSNQKQLQQERVNRPQKSSLNYPQNFVMNQPQNSLVSRRNPKVTSWTRSDNRSYTKDRGDTKSRPNDENLQDSRREKLQRHPDSQNFSNRFHQAEDKVWNERQDQQLSKSLESPKVDFYQLALSRGLDPNNKDVIKILEMSVQLEALQALAAQQRAEVVTLGTLNLLGLAHPTVDSVTQPAANNLARESWNNRDLDDGTRRSHEDQKELEAYSQAEQILKDNIAVKMKLLEELEQMYKGRKREDESANTKDSRVGYNVPSSETSSRLAFRQDKNILHKSGMLFRSDSKSSQSRAGKRSRSPAYRESRTGHRSRSPAYRESRTSSVHSRSRSPLRSRGERLFRKKEIYNRHLESEEQMSLDFIDPAFDPNRNDDPLDFNKPASTISTEQAVNQDFVRTLEVLKDMKPILPKKEKFQSVEELCLPVRFGKNALKKTPKEIEEEKKMAKKEERKWGEKQDRNNYIDSNRGYYDSKNFFTRADDSNANSLFHNSEKQNERGISYIGRGSQDSMNYWEQFRKNSGTEKQNISTASSRLPARVNRPDHQGGGPQRGYSRDNHQSWNSGFGEKDGTSQSELDLPKYSRNGGISSLRNRPGNNDAVIGQHTTRYEEVSGAGDARQSHTGKNSINDFQKLNNSMLNWSQASKPGSEHFGQDSFPGDTSYQCVSQPSFEPSGASKQSGYLNKLNPGFYEPSNKTINSKLNTVGNTVPYTRESETAFVYKFNEPSTTNKYSEVSRGSVNRPDWLNSGTLSRNQAKSRADVYSNKTNESPGLLGERPDAVQTKPTFGEPGNTFDQRTTGQFTEFRNAQHQHNISDGRFDWHSTSYNIDAKKSGLLNTPVTDKGNMLYPPTLNQPFQQDSGQEFTDFGKPPRGNLSSSTFNRGGLNPNFQSARGRGGNMMGRGRHFNRSKFSSSSEQVGDTHGEQLTGDTFSSTNDFDSTGSYVTSNRGRFGRSMAAQNATRPSKTIPSLFDLNKSNFAGVQGQIFPASRGRHGQF